MAHNIVHWEIMGANGDELAGFYGGIFDWNPQSTEGFNSYNMVSGDEAGLGGAVGQGDEHMPNYVTVYVGVADIDAHLAKIEAAGGKTVAPKVVIPDMVTFALFADPAGNVVGLVESATSAG